MAARAVPMDRATPAENIAHAAPAAAAATAAHATHATHGTHHRGQRPKSDSIPRKSLDAAAKPPRATSTSSTTQASGSSSACLAPPASPASPKQQGASAPAAAPAPVVLEMPESLLPAPTSTSLTAALEDVTVTLASADLAPADLSTVERAGPAPVAALYAAAAETEPQLGAPPPLAGHAEPLAPEHDVAALRATIASLRAELTREQALREQLERQARLQTRGDNDRCHRAAAPARTLMHASPAPWPAPRVPSFMELATTNALLLERISALEASKQQLENLVRCTTPCRLRARRPPPSLCARTHACARTTRSCVGGHLSGAHRVAAAGAIATAAAAAG